MLFFAWPSTVCSSDRAPRIAPAGRFDLDDFRAHRGEVARRRRAGDHPAEIEHAHAGQRQRTVGGALLAVRRGDTAGRTACPAPGSACPPSSLRPVVAAMPHLRRVQMLRDLAQGKARHVRALRRVGDPLLAVLPAPLRHQRMQGIPVLHPVGLGDEARVGAPGGRSHRLQPRRPLLLLARGDRGIAVARRQDRHRRAVAVAQALAVPALAVPRPARASSVMASVASASWIETSIDAPG